MEGQIIVVFTNGNGSPAGGIVIQADGQYPCVGDPRWPLQLNPKDGRYQGSIDPSLATVGRRVSFDPITPGNDFDNQTQSTAVNVQGI